MKTDADDSLTFSKRIVDRVFIVNYYMLTQEIICVTDLETIENITRGYASFNNN